MAHGYLHFEDLGLLAILEDYKSLNRILIQLANRPSSLSKTPSAKGIRACGKPRGTLSNKGAIK